MSHALRPAVVIVPGLKPRAPGHWQAHLERKLSNAVAIPVTEPESADALSCAARVRALDRAVANRGDAVVLVAHGTAVTVVAQWALRYRRAIRGALLVTPADVESPLPPQCPSMETLRQNGWAPVPRRPLPFPSIVAASTNDPLARFPRVAEFAAHWGSSIVNLGAVGHLDPASGFGEWPRAEAFVDELCAAA